MNDLFSNLPTIRTDRATLIHGDCIAAVDKMEPNSIDAIVTDAPYHLTSIVKRFKNTSQYDDNGTGRRANARSDAMARLSRGFMGKTWDGGDIAFQPATWAAMWRVLKPGAHMMVFGGTRTFHRMAVAIEDAGFEIRDMLMWLYGCLDDQTMAVTSNGVMPHHKIKKGDLVLAYDPVYNSYQWEPVEEIFTYEISDTVYRIATDYGDQIVSRNHRCIVERDGKEIFQFAEDASREQEICVPILENLQTLLDTISDPYTGTSNTEENLFAELFESGSVNISNVAPRCVTQGQIESEMFHMRNDVLAKHETFESDNDSCLLTQMQRENSWTGTDQIFSQRSCELERGIQKGTVRTNDRRHESGMERRRDVQKTERKLQVGSVRSMSHPIPANVASGRICDGTQIEGGAENRSNANADRMRSSYRSQSSEQRTDKSNAFCNEQRSQTVRAWRGHKTVVGRIVPEKYNGVIWCIRVKSGAFVAVRNGFAFPTGNSGFPKSHDVSKGIDAHLGAERDRTPTLAMITGSEVGKISKNLRCAVCGKPRASADPCRCERLENIPATSQAEQWNGWGTALKPAWEPIILARKPLIGSVAANVLQFGTGAINIDASRIGTDVVGWSGAAAGGNTWNDSNMGLGKDGNARPVEGRWPANVLHDGSPEVVAMFPTTTSSRGIKGGTNPNPMDWGNERADASKISGYSDSGSAARFFYSAKATKADRNGSKHPTVKPIALLEYFARMITPPGGTILDPFGGSGTMIAAAQRIGARCIVVERDPWYFLDMTRRLR